MLAEILEDESAPLLDRLRRAIVTFFRSEREEASLRAALDDAGADLRDAPEARAIEQRSRVRFAPFFERLLPDLSSIDRANVAELVMTAISAIGERVSHRIGARPRVETDRLAFATAAMICAYVESLRSPTKRAPSVPRTSSKRPGSTERSRSIGARHSGGK